MSAYLEAHGAFTRLFCVLERSIGVQLDYRSEPPVLLSPLVFPKPRSLAWFEATVGHRLQTSEGETARLSNHRRWVELPLG